MMHPAAPVRYKKTCRRQLSYVLQHAAFPAFAGIKQYYRWTDIHNNIYRMVSVILRSRMEYPKIIQPGYRAKTSTLPLFVLWILTNDPNPAFSFDDFTFVTHRLYR